MGWSNPDSTNQPVADNQGRQEQGTGQNFVRPNEVAPVQPSRSASTVPPASETTPAIPTAPNTEPKVETPREINQELDPNKEQKVVTPATDNNQPATLTPPPPASITKEPQIIQPQAHIDQGYHTKTVHTTNVTTPQLLANKLPQEPTAQNASQTVEALKKLKASKDQSLKRAA